MAAFRLDVPTKQVWLVVFDIGSGSMRNLASMMEINRSGILEFAWSCDGQAIAFTRTTGGFSDSQLYTIDIEGKRETQLTNSGFNGSPTWSPDGQQIAFDVTEGTTAYACIVNADGSGRKIAPYRAKRLVRNLTWSPDGENVAFDGPPDSTFLGTYTSDVFICDRAGTRLIQVTTDGMSWLPSWSPDGKYIAFVSRRDGGVNAYTVRRDGTGLFRLTGHGKVSETQLVWSPDGTMLLYTFIPHQYTSTIAVINSDGSHDLNLGVEAIQGYSWKR